MKTQGRFSTEELPSHSTALSNFARMCVWCRCVLHLQKTPFHAACAAFFFWRNLRIRFDLFAKMALRKDHNL